MTGKQLVRWLVALFLALPVLAVPAITPVAGAVQAQAAQRIENRAGGCLAATSATAGAFVNVVACTSAHRWVVTQHPTNPNFYLIRHQANTGLCLAAVPQVNQRVQLAFCSNTNTAWYIVLIGGWFWACHTHDTGVCASTRLRPQVTIDWRNNADPSQQFRLI